MEFTKFEFDDIDNDGRVDGHPVETFYQSIERIAIVENTDGEKFLAVISDGTGYDVETRVPLNKVAEFIASAES